MSIIAIIPARMESTRFPGKPLADLHGKPMIQHVYERVAQCSEIQEVYVATDSVDISTTVVEFGGLVVSSRNDHGSGTSRVREAATKLYENHIIKYHDWVLNVQADEPMIHPDDLDLLCDASVSGPVLMSTLYHKITDLGDLEDENVVKVMFDGVTHNAVYFTRQPAATTFRHIGVYLFRYDLLQMYPHLTDPYDKQHERLEQLKWLHARYPIFCVEAQHPTFGIDTPEQLEELKKKWEQPTTITLIRIVAPHFCAGILISTKNDVVVRTAPILKYMRGWETGRVLAYAEKKGWKANILS